MSRIVKQNSQYEIAYGLDHLVGIFIQVFDLKHANDDDEGLVIDLDEWTNEDLTVERIVAIAEEHGFDISDELNNRTINYED